MWIKQGNYDFYCIRIYITKNENLKNKQVLKTDRPSEARRRLLN